MNLREIAVTTARGIVEDMNTGTAVNGVMSGVHSQIAEFLSSERSPAELELYRKALQEELMRLKEPEAAAEFEQTFRLLNKGRNTRTIAHSPAVETVVPIARNTIPSGSAPAGAKKEKDAPKGWTSPMHVVNYGEHLKGLPVKYPAKSGYGTLVRRLLKMRNIDAESQADNKTSPDTPTAPPSQLVEPKKVDQGGDAPKKADEAKKEPKK
jgi:hypothetical protein